MTIVVILFMLGISAAALGINQLTGKEIATVFNITKTENQIVVTSLNKTILFDLEVLDFALDKLLECISQAYSCSREWLLELYANCKKFIGKKLTLDAC